jgi:hypothetical protein
LLLIILDQINIPRSDMKNFAEEVFYAVPLAEKGAVVSSAVDEF